MRKVLAPILLAALLTGGIAQSIRGDEPDVVVEKSPTTRPSTPERLAEIQKSFELLADSDPVVRAKARMDLMGMELDELETLADLVSRSKPLQPQQRVMLREIVQHVWLAHQSPSDLFRGHAMVGFLGVNLDRTYMRDGGLQAGPAIVTGRVPGCIAYRMLEDGDILIGLDEPEKTPDLDSENFVLRIQDLSPGTRVVLRVLRNGRTVSVPANLSARSRMTSLLPTEELRPRAERYWHNRFVPLLMNNAT